jgi:hypothetical protein
MHLIRQQAKGDNDGNYARIIIRGGVYVLTVCIWFIMQTNRNSYCRVYHLGIMVIIRIRNIGFIMSKNN